MSKVLDLQSAPSGVFHCGICNGRNHYIEGTEVYCSHCGNHSVNVTLRIRSEEEMQRVEDNLYGSEDD